jgi:hypothetical protein
VNFQPALADLVMAGRKTVTRRAVSANPRSPWWEGGCKLTVGRDYAVCPGRAKGQIGRVRIVAIDLQALGALSDAEARLEGFGGALAFREAWLAINGRYDPEAWVWRVEFERAA